MKSKKILIVTSEFPPQPGGIANHAFNLALKLSENHYSVCVLCDNRSKKGLEELEFDREQPFVIERIKRRPFIFITYLDRIIRYLKRANKVDMVMASGKFSLWLVGLNYKSNKKSIAVIHGSEVNFKGFKRFLTNYALQCFDEIIAVSNHTKSLISNLNLRHIHVIPNGFNIKKQEYSNFKSVSEPLKLITVGNVTERKGQINIIKALPKLIRHFPNLEYHIVGIPTEKLKLEAYASKLNVSNHLIFYGRVDEFEKRKLLLESDIFVMLSNETETGDIEGFGIALIEANALGLPAIGAKNSGILDAISDDFSGKLIAPTDSDALILAIETIKNNYEQFSKNSKTWSNNFDWNKIIKQYIQSIE